MTITPSAGAVALFAESPFSGIPLASAFRSRFTVRPPQIVMLRLRTNASGAAIKPPREGEKLVPPQHRAALHEYPPDKKGHPPRGSRKYHKPVRPDR